MLKKYIAPSIYCEDLELNPVIGTTCTDEPAVYEAEWDTDEHIGGPNSYIWLVYANSWDCIGYTEDIIDPSSGNSWYFSMANEATSPCKDIKNAKGYDPRLANYTMYPYSCYHTSYYVLGTTIYS